FRELSGALVDLLTNLVGLTSHRADEAGDQRGDEQTDRETNPWLATELYGIPLRIWSIERYPAASAKFDHVSPVQVIPKLGFEFSGWQLRHALTHAPIEQAFAAIRGGVVDVDRFRRLRRTAQLRRFEH